MGALTYLELCNRVIRRISQTEITDVSAAAGQGKIISNMVNEAQASLSMQENWYSLYASRTFNTVAATATSAFATDFARCIDLTNTTSHMVLVEDSLRTLTNADFGSLIQGIPTHFTALATEYMFYPIPAGVYAMRERYWRKPTEMTANANTSALPDFCDNLIIYHAWMSICEYLNKFSVAEMVRSQFEREMAHAKTANRKIIDQMRIFRNVTGGGYNQFPRLPSHYPAS